MSNEGDRATRTEPTGPSTDGSAADGSVVNGSGTGRSAADPSNGGPALVYVRVLDALVYAVGVAVAVVLSVVATLASFAVGGGWSGVKYLLFLVGFFVFGVTAFSLRPAGAWTDRDEGSAGTCGETRFQAAVQATPPLRRYDLAPNERLRPAAKLFVASLLVLGVSFAMEAVLGVPG